MRSGGTPHFSSTALRSKRVEPLPSRPGLSTTTSSVDELQQVLVRGDDDDLQALLDRLPGEGRDRVVRLVAGDLDDRHPQRLAHPPDVRDLHGEVVVHLRAVGLVLRVLLVAERLPRRVEEDGDVLRTLVLEELPQHRGEAVGGVRGQALAGGEAADRVEGAVELAGAVDEVDRLRGGHLPTILVRGGRPSPTASRRRAGASGFALRASVVGGGPRSRSRTGPLQLESPGDAPPPGGRSPRRRRPARLPHLRVRARDLAPGERLRHRQRHRAAGPVDRVQEPAPRRERPRRDEEGGPRAVRAVGARGQAGHGHDSGAATPTSSSRRTSRT